MSQEACAFKKKSTFVPNIVDPSITVFEKMVINDLKRMESVRYKIKHNISRGETSCLKELAEDRSITIKPADKGGGIVVLDIDTYMTEASRQLGDRSAYHKIKGDPTTSIKISSKLLSRRPWHWIILIKIWQIF